MEAANEQQWVVVCFSFDHPMPTVYGAWGTEEAAAEWLDETHLGDANTCFKDADPEDHWVVTAEDSE